MNRSSLIVLIALVPLCTAPSSPAQTLEGLNLHAHGYATQAVVYSDRNNWNKTDSTNGSPAWTEGVANLTSQPKPRLRIGIQTRYSFLGNYGQKVNLDWASAEFKVNEYFGVRAGKVKTSTALMNESQDIDPAYTWIVLPSSIYPISSRSGNLAHFGAVLFGNVPLGKSLGKVEYRTFGGQRRVGADDGYLDAARSAGLTPVDGVHGPTFGGSLRWHTSRPGLLAGAGIGLDRLSGHFTMGNLRVTNQPSPTKLFLFSQYEHRRWLIAGEYSRAIVKIRLRLFEEQLAFIRQDSRSFYGLATYKFAQKLTGGLYFSSTIDKQMPPGAGRYQKDWALAARYDPNSFLYLKVEQHFLDGTALNFSQSNNQDGLKETSHLSLVKLGVTF